MTIAEKLKYLRKEHNMTQEDMAEKLNVNFRTISAWEKSICEPSIEMLVKISEFFDEILMNYIESLRFYRIISCKTIPFHFAKMMF